MSGDYPNHWAVLMDKGYQGSAEMIRSVTTHKKPPHGVLTREQEDFNKKLSSQRILVENFFGRMLSIWNIMAAKYRWVEKLYDKIAVVCVGLTNFIVEKRPLRADDGRWYRRYSNRLLHIGEEKKRKRAESQALYIARRRQRLRETYRSANLSDTEDED